MKIKVCLLTIIMICMITIIAVLFKQYETKEAENYNGVLVWKESTVQTFISVREVPHL